jgi:hypothetical protein
MQLGGAAPKHPAIELEEERIVKSGNVGMVIENWFNLCRDTIRPVPVIVVPMHYDLTTRRVASCVAHSANRAVLFHTKMAYTRVIWNYRTKIALTAVNNNKLSLRIILF